MIVRRIASALAVALWLAPAAVAGGVALHVAFDHQHEAVDHGGAAHAAPLLALVDHGHLHTGDAGEHGHPVAWTATPALRAARSVVTPPLAAAKVDTAHAATALPARAAGGSPAPPAQAAGPPLLALLSTLRI